MTFDELDRLLAGAPAALGYLGVTTPRGERSYVLGPRTAVDEVPPMVDWRTAPLAGVFFRHGPGEPYELDTGAVATEGRVIERYVLVGRGTLQAAVSDERERTATGDRATLRPAPARMPPRDRNVLPVLDPEQQHAADLPPNRSLVLDGEAGVGKTLVALFRLARLEKRAKERGQRFRPLVLVPTEGLRRLVRLISDRLGIGRVEIAVLDDWMLERAMTAFSGLPKRTSESATAQVIALKRHPAVRAVLRDFVGWKPPRGVDDDKISKTRRRLLHLWGDRDRLLRVIAASGDQLPPRAIDAAMKHTRAQFQSTTESTHQHVDAERLVALDGKRLDSGTPMQDAHTFDLEDVPILFELARLGALKAEPLPLYDHIVIDEAQLRAPLELAAIGDALDEYGTITLAGDHRQATDESAWFTGWDAARTELAREHWTEVTLSVTYRSVPAIGTLAREIVERAPRPLPPLPPPDPAVWATPHASAFAQAAALCWHLDALVARDPWRQICVIARTPEHARRLHAELGRGLDPVLVLDGDFRFEPGIIVTTAASVSGLEFDAVVIPDLTPAFWPATPELARSLYVAATRARDFLWLLTPDAWTPLLGG